MKDITKNLLVVASALTFGGVGGYYFGLVSLVVTLPVAFFIPIILEDV